MLSIVAVALALSPAPLPPCSWDHPGQDPYTRDVAAAVDDYRDIPPSVRARLKRRLAAHRYDEVVAIERDRIVGRRDYDTQIRDMHFGAKGRICGTVSRAHWAAGTIERGLVYCESGECILVPTVCNNVSRIVRLPAVVPDRPAEPLAAAPGIPTSPGAPVVAIALNTLPLSFAAVATPEAADLRALSVDQGPPFPRLRQPPLPLAIPTTGPPWQRIPPPLQPTVPEPGSWALMVIGLAAAMGIRAIRSRRRSA